jgi:hypothetical protein
MALSPCSLVAVENPVAGLAGYPELPAEGRSTATEQRLRLERPGRAPLLLNVLPVWRLGVDLPGIAAPRVAVVISKPDAPAPIDRVAFADTYRLTTREREIAILLGHGLDLQAIALQLGIGIGTVRHHLKECVREDRRTRPGGAGSAATRFRHADELVARRGG